jgi:hypothetical protein
MTATIEQVVRKLTIPALVLSAAAVACDDPFGPAFWSDAPVEAVLYSSSRVEYVGQPSVFDFIDLQRLPVELPGATGNWDVALVDTPDGLALAPATAVTGLASQAAIAVMPGDSLSSVTEAPRDTAAFRQTPVLLEPNTVYVVRTRRAACGFGTSGVRYAKLEAIEIDDELGVLRFRYARNPYCNDRALVPPAD